ncbi:MAG: NmrA family NAD(P)-binding protein [Chryseolinea sp.]
MNNQNNSTVFGATGKTGKELLTFLSEANIPTIAVTRDKSNVKNLPNIEWIEADMSKKETLEQTMKNSKSVFLASSVNQNFATEQNNVIESAKQCGVQHIVKLSSPGADKKSQNVIARLNGEVENILKASGVKFTIIQPNSFMQNWLGYFSETVQRERKIYEATGEGKKPFIDTRDIAEVAFKILTKSENHINKSHLLTGGIAVNYGQVAEGISKVIGGNVEYISLTSDEAKQRMEEKGMTPMMINTFLAIAEGQRNGKADFVNTVAEEILGKKPITVEEFAKHYSQFFK